jgi:hypothetical protein
LLCGEERVIRRLLWTRTRRLHRPNSRAKRMLSSRAGYSRDNNPDNNPDNNLTNRQDNYRVNNQDNSPGNYRVNNRVNNPDNYRVNSLDSSLDSSQRIRQMPLLPPIGATPKSAADSASPRHLDNNPVCQVNPVELRPAMKHSE